MQQLTVSKVSLASPSSSIVDEYIPLWVYSSGNTSTTTTANRYLQKGSTTTAPNTTGSAAKLYTLNSTWRANQKFAFEASINVVSGGTCTVVIYDDTGGSVIASSQITTTSTTFTVVRSATFTLVPGRVYAVGIQTSNSSFAATITKAHLVALGG